jgi:uncharacterized protein YcbX
MKPIGEIKEIIRYPVKSFQGERVQKTRVMKGGLYGDRSHAFLDESRPGKFLTITQCPEMARYRARFRGEESPDRYPPVEVTAPDGRVYRFGDDELQRRIEGLAKKKVSPVMHAPDGGPNPAIEEESVLIVTDASLRELGKWRRREVALERFRPNLLIALHDPVPFAEDDWVGRTLKAGGVELAVNRPCERCMIVTVDPKDASRDPSLLRTLVKERDSCFGVYAAVIRPGVLQVGDRVFLTGS